MCDEKDIYEGCFYIWDDDKLNRDERAEKFFQCCKKKLAKKLGKEEFEKWYKEMYEPYIKK